MIIYLKSQEEIEGFKVAGRMTGEILSLVSKKVKPGVSTEELNQFVIDECEKRNVKPAFLGQYDFPAAICASVNNCLVHGIPNNRPLQEGDLVSIDLGIDYNGFIGDSAITIYLKEAPHQLILNCEYLLSQAISQAKPGNKLSDISKAIQNNAMFSIPFGYGGHGINRGNLHAAPFVPNVEEQEGDVNLYPGMIFAIEPMLINGSEITIVSEDGFSVMADGDAAHCEHTILITEDQPIVLTERNQHE